MKARLSFVHEACAQNASQPTGQNLSLCCGVVRAIHKRRSQALCVIADPRCNVLSGCIRSLDIALMQALLSMATAANDAARYDPARAVAKWPSISEEMWERLSPDGWNNAVVTGGPACSIRYVWYTNSIRALRNVVPRCTSDCDKPIALAHACELPHSVHILQC